MSRFPIRVSRTHWLVCVPLLLAWACQGPETGSPQGSARGTSLEPTLEAPSDDRSVGEHLVQHLRDTRVVGGLREVDLDLQNRSELRIEFSYQVEWLDHQGQVLVDGEALWTPLVLEPGERMPLSLRAPHPAAESWRLVAVALIAADNPEK